MTKLQRWKADVELAESGPKVERGWEEGERHTKARAGLLVGRGPSVSTEQSTRDWGNLNAMSRVYWGHVFSSDAVL